MLQRGEEAVDNRRTVLQVKVNKSVCLSLSSASTFCSLQSFLPLAFVFLSPCTTHHHKTSFAHHVGRDCCDAITASRTATLGTISNLGRRPE